MKSSTFLSIFLFSFLSLICYYLLSSSLYSLFFFPFVFILIVALCFSNIVCIAIIYYLLILGVIMSQNPFMPTLESLLNRYFKVSKPSDKNPQSSFAVLPSIKLAEQLKEVSQIDNLYVTPTGEKFYFQIYTGEATNKVTGETFISRLIFFNPVKSVQQTEQTSQVTATADVPF